MRFLCRICWYLSRKEKHFLGSERLPVFLEQMPQTESVTSVTRSRSLSSLRRTGPSRGRRPLPPPLRAPRGRPPALTARSRWRGPCSGTPRCSGSAGRSPPAATADTAVTARFGPASRAAAEEGCEGGGGPGRSRRCLSRAGLSPAATPGPRRPLTRCSVSWFTSALPRSRSGTNTTDIPPPPPRACAEGSAAFAPALREQLAAPPSPRLAPLPPRARFPLEQTPPIPPCPVRLRGHEITPHSLVVLKSLFRLKIKTPRFHETK